MACRLFSSCSFFPTGSVMWTIEAKGRYKECWQFTSAKEETHNPLIYLQMSFTFLMKSSSYTSDFLCFLEAAGFILYYCTILALYKICSIIIVMLSHRHSGVRFFFVLFCLLLPTYLDGFKEKEETCNGLYDVEVPYGM